MGVGLREGGQRGRQGGKRSALSMAIAWAKDRVDGAPSSCALSGGRAVLVPPGGEGQVLGFQPVVDGGGEGDDVGAAAPAPS